MSSDCGKPVVTACACVKKKKTNKKNHQKTNQNKPTRKTTNKKPTKPQNTSPLNPQTSDLEMWAAK